MVKKTAKSVLGLALVLVLLMQLALPTLAVGTAGMPHTITMTVYEQETGSYGAAWHCSEAYDGVLQVTTADDSAFSEAASYPATRETDYFGSYDYHAVATGLADNTKYLYRVGKEGAWSNTGSFTTSPAEDQSYTFLHVTDTQGRTTAGYTTYEGFHQAVTAAEAIYGEVPLIFHTGDMVDTALSESQWYEVLDDGNAGMVQSHLLSSVAGPVHESTNDALAEHFTFNMPAGQNDPGNGYYSYDYGDVHFVCLNVNDVETAGGLSAAQLRWLKTDLGKTDRTWIVVGMHYSLYDNGVHRAEETITAVRDQLNPVFFEYGVDLVLSGHDHVYNRSFPLDADGNIAEDGVVYVEGGPAGYKHYTIDRYNALRVAAQYAPVDGGSTKANTEIMFNAITVNGDTLTLKAYKGSITDTTGDTYSEVDSFTLTKDAGDDRRQTMHKAELSYSESTSIDVTQVGFAEKNDYITETVIRPVSAGGDDTALEISADGKVQSELITNRMPVTGGSDYQLNLETAENGLVAQAYYYAWDDAGNELAMGSLADADVIRAPADAASIQLYVQISGRRGSVRFERLSLAQLCGGSASGWTLSAAHDANGAVEEVAELVDEGCLDPGALHITNSYYPDATYASSDYESSTAQCTVSGLTVGEKYILTLYARGKGTLDMMTWGGLLNEESDTYVGTTQLLLVTAADWTKVTVPLTGGATTANIQFYVDRWQTAGCDMYIDNISLTAVGSEENLIENGNLYASTTDDGWYNYATIYATDGTQVSTVVLSELGYEDAGSLHFTSTYFSGSLATNSSSGNSSVYYTLTGLTAGETYTMSMWVKGSGFLGMRYKNGSSSVYPNVLGSNGGTFGDTNGEWQKIDVPLSISTATSEMYLFTSRWQNSDIYVDGITLTDSKGNAVAMNGTFAVDMDFEEKFENSDFDAAPTVWQNVAAAAEAEVDGDTLTVTLIPRRGEALPTTLALNYAVGGTAITQTAAADGDTYRFTMPPQTDGGMTLAVSETEVALAAKFAGATVTLGDCLDLRYYLEIPDALLTDGMQVTFTMGTSSFTYPLGDRDATGYYVVPMEVPAKDMNNPITARLVDGHNVYAEKVYTIREYGEAILNGSAYSDKEKTAARAMLNYGAMAQVYFGVSGDPANASCAYTQAELDAADLSTVTAMTAESPVDFAGSTLVLKTRTAVRLYFYSQVTGSVLNENNGLYYVEIAGLGADDLAKVQTVTVDGATYRLSALSLAKKVIEGDYAADFQNLMKALTLYADAAEALASVKDAGNDQTEII